MLISYTSLSSLESRKVPSAQRASFWCSARDPFRIDFTQAFTVCQQRPGPIHPKHEYRPFPVPLPIVLTAHAHFLALVLLSSHSANPLARVSIPKSHSPKHRGRGLALIRHIFPVSPPRQHRVINFALRPFFILLSRHPYSPLAQGTMTAVNTRQKLVRTPRNRRRKALAPHVVWRIWAPSERGIVAHSENPG
jgi:hypothetical protein